MSDGAPGGLVDANASEVLRRPFAMVLILALVAGAMDAADFRAFGVFTANQAGNMVLLWVNLLDQPAVALLSLFSLLGCALGVAFVVVLRSLRRWFSGPSGSRLLLYVAALVLGVTAFAGVALFDPARNAAERTLTLWSAEWWAAAASVSSSAFSLGVLATVFIWAGRNKVLIIASTGPFVDASRYFMASIVYRSAEYREQWRHLISFPLAWSAGALVVGLLPVNRGVIALFGVAVVIAIATLARRVQSAPPPALSGAS